MQRGRFAPRRWCSEDGKWLYILHDTGSIDILPGPNSEPMRFLQERYISNKASKITSPNYVHWAIKAE